MSITASVDPKRLIAGYQLCASTEGKTKDSIQIVITSLNSFQRYLSRLNRNLSLIDVTRYEIRDFISYLQQIRSYASHPLIHPKERGLSGHTINTYLRSLRIFYSWLVSEEIIENHPFEKVKIPRPPVKVITAFSNSQIEQLIKAINTKTAVGYRDLAIIMTLLDTGIRISELCSLKMEKLWLEDVIGKVLGKGNKERMIPIGKKLQHILWHYINHCRPDPITMNYGSVFLTQAGRPLTVRRMQKILTIYGQKAKLTGIRCSPHTFRHTAAISFLRNGGDLFSLQRMLGHTTLEMTRKYCELADTDVKKAHSLASPVDNLDFTSGVVTRRSHSPKSLTHPQGDNTSNFDRYTAKPDMGGYKQGIVSRQSRTHTRMGGYH